MKRKGLEPEDQRLPYEIKKTGENQQAMFDVERAPNPANIKFENFGRQNCCKQFII